MGKMKVNKLTTASFDVDAEKCFTPLCPNELPVIGGDQIVVELNAQAKFACFRIGSKDAHSPFAEWVTQDPNLIAQPIPEGLHGPNSDLYWPVHGVPGTKGFELLDGLPKPEDYDYFVWKGVELSMHPYGAVYHDLANALSTGVIEYLRCNGVKTVITSGIATDFCAGITALQLKGAGFEVIFNKAGSRGISVEGTEAMYEKMHHNGVILIESSSELTTY